MSNTMLLRPDDLAQRGVAEDLRILRPILAANVSREEAMLGHATLRKDEWEMVDERVNAVLRERLTVADDLRAAGLIQPVSLGTILRVTERGSEMADAEVSFDGDAAPTRDRPTFSRDTIPVPIIARGFEIGWRQLEASRTRGEPLDMTAAESATRRVRDKLQDIITNGYTRGPNGNTIPGCTSAANRVTVNLTTAWDASGGDPVGDVERVLAAAYAVNLFGPFILYVPKNYWALLQRDYSTTKGDRTYMERILAFVDIQAVRPNDSLADDNVVMVQLTRDVIDLSEAQAVTTVQWERTPFVTEFRVLMVGGPQIKNALTSGGTAVHGIVHLRASS